MKDVYRGRWSISLVKAVILEAVHLSIPAMRETAARLKSGRGLEEDARRVFDFIRREVRYVRDPARIELIKTARASLNDDQGDCEDMTILAVSLLANMGYKDARAMIIAQGEGWSHIFAVVGQEPRRASGIDGLVIDCVPEIPGFNDIAPDISDKMEVRLQLEGLAGMPGRDIAIAGLGAVAPATSVTGYALRSSETMIAGLSGLAGHAREQSLCEIRKANALVLLNGAPEQEALAAIMPYVSDVRAGRLLFTEDAPLDAIAGFLEEEELAQIQGIAGIGRADRRRKLRQEAGKPRRKPGEQTKAGKVISTINRYNPATVAVRNGLLLALRINLFKLSEHLALGYLPDGDARAAGLDAGQLTKLKGSLEAVQKIHIALGGRLDSLQAAIVAGAAKELQLGEAVAAASTAAASGVLAKIGTLLKKVDLKALVGKMDKAKLKDSFKKLRGKTQKVEADLPAAVAASETQKVEVETGGATDPMGDNATPGAANREAGGGTGEEKKNSMALPLLIGVGVLAVALSSSK